MKPLLLAAFLISAQAQDAPNAATLDAITFAARPDVRFLPAREVANIFGWDVRWNSEERQLYLQDKKINMEQTERLPNGTVLIHTGTMEALGLTEGWIHEQNIRTLSEGDEQVLLRVGDKRAVVNKDELELRAYQGERQVMSSRISVGAEGHETPNGTFEAGPYKAEMHRSTIYDNAPMPWSVQVTGNVFIHGWKGNVGGENSHGCIRLPLDGSAKFFYRWIDLGTPVAVQGEWPAGAVAESSPESNG